MKYQLILQWSGSLLDDYDAIISIGELLIEQLPADSEVDGHDIGSGEANIFILTNEPERDFVISQRILAGANMLHPSHVAFRWIGNSEFKVIWPVGSNEFTVS